MNYLKYWGIMLNARINKKLQLKYITINKEYKSVLIRNFGELYLAYFYDKVWLKIDKFNANDKNILLKIVKHLIKKHKTIYLVEEEKVFTDADIKNLYNISRNIFIYQLYMDKTKELASNQILICDIASYMLILDKIDFYEKICNRYCKTELDKVVFTIVELAYYIKFDSSNTKETSCLTNAFLLKHGVCIDFAIAFWKCMERLNIGCRIVKGIGNENHVKNKLLLFDHAWNQVKISEKWYNIDITWFSSTGDVTYFLANDNVFYEEGRHKTRFKVKSCTDNIDYNEILQKIELIKKYKNIFEEFDKNNKEIKLNKI